MRLGVILAAMALATVFNVLGNISQKIGSIALDSLFNKYEQLEPAALVEEAPEE